jgi:hypothetical protein
MRSERVMRPLHLHDSIEQQIDDTIIRLRAKLPCQIESMVLAYLLGSGVSLADAAYPWPALAEVENTLTQHEVPLDVNAAAQVPLSPPQFEALHLMAAMRLLGVHRELVKGAWKNDDERSALVQERRDAFCAYQALENLKPMVSPIFSVP